MGCDIHYVIEQDMNGVWVGIHQETHTPMPQGSLHGFDDKGPFECPGGNAYVYPVLKSRNYDFFAALAGVRGDGPDANGIPEDASDLSNARINRDGDDGHSHGHDPLRVFVTKWLLSQEDEGNARDLMLDRINKNGFLNEKIFKLTGISAEEDDLDYTKYRVVYWFDN